MNHWMPRINGRKVATREHEGIFEGDKTVLYVSWGGSNTPYAVINVHRIVYR